MAHFETDFGQILGDFRIGRSTIDHFGMHLNHFKT